MDGDRTSRRDSLQMRCIQHFTDRRIATLDYATLRMTKKRTSADDRAMNIIRLSRPSTIEAAGLLAGAPGAPLHVHIHFCIPDDQERHLPRRRRAPAVLPREVPLPRVGELVYLSSTSAWVVTRIVHEWRSPEDLHIELWLDWIGSARHARPPGFAMTQ
jgi:hypothetical protein